jgi:hypothetical protein
MTNSRHIFTVVESGGPPSSVFIKVARTKRTKNRFRGKVICGLNTDIVTQNEFLPSEMKC